MILRLLSPDRAISAGDRRSHVLDGCFMSVCIELKETLIANLLSK